MNAQNQPQVVEAKAAESRGVAMIKIIATTVSLALVAAAVVWTMVVNVEPKATVSGFGVSMSAASASLTHSPFELMRKQGKNLLAEQWDAF